MKNGGVEIEMGALKKDNIKQKYGNIYPNFLVTNSMENKFSSLVSYFSSPEI